ncbi:MAG: toll/interleukin-1 receptor domain-containing protein [Chloroflexi bacterium]|nr:toll/interleukin-1 receptor domain-containing protein [Chloroflexota bacterium]
MTKVFISYAWDSKEHKTWVRNLSTRLKNRGVDVTLDQWHLVPGDQIPEFMERAVRESDFVLIVCTQKYKERSDSRSGGVGYEGDVMTAEVLSSHNQRKFIPILRGASWKESAPTWLLGKYYIDLSSTPYSKDEYKKLLKALLEKVEPAHFAQNATIEYPLLQKRLLSFGIPLHKDLQKEGVLDKLGAKFAIDDVIVDGEFAGFRGIASNQLSIKAASTDSPNLPDYVYEARNKIPRPSLNKWKAYLENWKAPIIDLGDVVSMQIGHLDSKTSDGKYDYWTTVAVLESLPRLQQELLTGKIQLRQLARRMDLVLVVVTSDKQLVLARRSEQVDNAKGFWMASVGESLDPSLDLDINRVPNPIEATRRCLGEYDELNLSSSDINGANMQILGIATEWQFLYANLIVLVQLNVKLERVKERASEGEHTRIEGISFTPQACLPLIRHGWYESDTKIYSAPLVPASRAALLMSLMSGYGYDDIVNRIK